MRRFRPFAEPRWNREVRPCLLRERTHRVQEIYRRRFFANTALGSLGDLRRAHSLNLDPGLLTLV